MLAAVSVTPSNGRVGRADFVRREKQILARRRKLHRDSKSEGDGAPQILARRRQLLRDSKSDEEEDALPGYRYERPDNPLILVRPPPKLPSVKSTVRFGIGSMGRHFHIRILRPTALGGPGPRGANPAKIWIHKKWWLATGAPASDWLIQKIFPGDPTIDQSPSRTPVSSHHFLCTHILTGIVQFNQKSNLSVSEWKIQI